MTLLIISYYQSGFAILSTYLVIVSVKTKLVTAGKYMLKEMCFDLDVFKVFILAFHFHFSNIYFFLIKPFTPDQQSSSIHLS